MEVTKSWMQPSMHPHLVLLETCWQTYRWKEEEPLGLYGTISAGYRHKVKRSEALGSV